MERERNGGRWTNLKWEANGETIRRSTVNEREGNGGRWTKCEADGETNGRLTVNERELSGVPLYSHSRLWNGRRVADRAVSQTGLRSLGELDQLLGKAQAVRHVIGQAPIDPFPLLLTNRPTHPCRLAPSPPSLLDW